MKAVILGAGRVGLGYLGQMLGESGYRVTVVERRPEIVEALNRGGYVIDVCYCDGSRSETRVEGIHAIPFSDEHTLAQELAEACLVFTAVGAVGLTQVGRVLARALQTWLTLPSSGSLDVISCENMPDSAAGLRKAVRSAVSEAEWQALEGRVRFRRAMVWRVITERTLLDGVVHTRADAAKRMDVEAPPALGPLLPIGGMVLRCDMEQAIREKLYGYNTGHGVAAYLGHVRGFQYVHEALQDPSIRSVVTASIQEAAWGLLCDKDPRPDLPQLASAYTGRYANPQLQDLIVRVAARPLQKLAPSERFVLPARAALAAGATPWGLAAGIAAALQYDHPDDAEAVRLQRRMKKDNVERSLGRITGLRETDLLGQLVLSHLPRHDGQSRVPACLAPANCGPPGGAAAGAKRVHFILAMRVPPVPSPVLVEVYERLRARGVAVDDCIPEEVLVCTGEFAVRHDLYVLKSHTELALSMAGMLNALGARLLNPYRSCLLTQDKVTSTKLLGDAGVPVPPSWVTDDYDLVRPFLARGPLIAKPHRGHRGSCVRVLRGPEDLASLCPTEGPFLFQQYLESDGEDLKAYVVGERAFAVTKRFSPDAFQYFGRPVELDARARDIVLTCGRVLGLHLYGVDLVVTDDGPFVVDVNYFPGFKGVPGAAQLIADYVHEYASSRLPAGHVGEGAG